MDHFSATPLAGYVIAHPTQIASALGGDFLGWGTAKGNLPDGTECSDNLTSSWHVYIDGFANGAYFCKSSYGSVANSAQDQFFRVEYTTCPGDGQPKWVFYWNSAWKTCKTINYAAGGPSAGSESGYNFPPDQTLTVRYAAIRTRTTSGDWIDFGALNTCEDAYVVAIHGARSWTVDP